jgi:hypothetical protein
MTKQISESTLEWCDEKAQVGGMYKIRLDDLAPTQFAVGRAEMLVRSARMKKKYGQDPQKLSDYLHVRPVPVVRRKKKFYLVDHHHLARALYEAMQPQQAGELCIPVKLLCDASSLHEIYFWKTMHAANWIYLFDHEGGGPKPPQTLPKHIKDLEFDPFRSLAWIVKERHGYLKTNAPFSEYKWANFLRTRLMLNQDILAGKPTFDLFGFKVDENGEYTLTADGHEAIEEAMFLVTTDEARGLPGYRGPGA